MVHAMTRRVGLPPIIAGPPGAPRDVCVDSPEGLDSQIVHYVRTPGPKRWAGEGKRQSRP